MYNKFIQNLIYNPLKMGNIEQTNTRRKELNLGKGWERITIEEAESKINQKDSGCFWWISEDNKWIITLENGKLNHYKRSEVILSLSEKNNQNHIVEDSKDKLVQILLRLKYSNKVKNREEAFQRAQNGEKEAFRFFFYDDNCKKIKIFDFSKSDKPEISEYPLKGTKIIYGMVSI